MGGGRQMESRRKEAGRERKGEGERRRERDTET